MPVGDEFNLPGIVISRACMEQTIWGKYQQLQLASRDSFISTCSFLTKEICYMRRYQLLSQIEACRDAIKRPLRLEVIWNEGIRSYVHTTYTLYLQLWVVTVVTVSQASGTTNSCRRVDEDWKLCLRPLRGDKRFSQRYQKVVPLGPLCRRKNKSVIVSLSGRKWVP
jgi:hypothetical protein